MGKMTGLKLHSAISRPTPKMDMCTSFYFKDCNDKIKSNHRRKVVSEYQSGEDIGISQHNGKFESGTVKGFVYTPHYVIHSMA